MSPHFLAGILIGDFNCAPTGGRLGYSLPLGDNMRRADEGLSSFCEDTGGTLVPATHHTLTRGAQRAALDNAITWNYHLAHPQVSSFKARHKDYDQDVLSFALPVQDFISTYKVPKGTLIFLETESTLSSSRKPFSSGVPTTSRESLPSYERMQRWNQATHFWTN